MVEEQDGETTSSPTNVSKYHLYVEQFHRTSSEHWQRIPESQEGKLLNMRQGIR